jgi:hypothetical protein
MEYKMVQTHKGKYAATMAFKLANEWQSVGITYTLDSLSHDEAKDKLTAKMGEVNNGG